MLVITQVKSDADTVAVKELIREYIAWAFTLEDRSDQAPTFQRLEGELANLPGVFAPPSGLLLLATVDGQPAGCVALKGNDAVTSELTRLYVRPTFRGHGIGRELMRTLVERARQAGYERIVLDSHVSMKEAHALYREFGFRQVQTPDDYPEALKSRVVFMECRLSEGA